MLRIFRLEATNVNLLIKNNISKSFIHANNYYYSILTKNYI